MAFENLRQQTFTQATSSVNTKIKEIYRTIPAVLRDGIKSKDNNGFFDYDLILSASDSSSNSDIFEENSVLVVQDFSSEEVTVYLTASLFRTMMNNHLSSSLPSSSYQTISASFFDQIGNGVSNMPGSEAYAGVLTFPFEPGSSSSLGTDITPPATASYELVFPGVVDNVSGEGLLVVKNNSTNALYSHFKFGNETSSLTQHQKNLTGALTSSNRHHLTRSFDNKAFHYIQPKLIPEFHVVYTPHSNDGSLFALTSSFSSSADAGVISGSAIASSSANAQTSGILAGFRFYDGTTPGAPGDGDGKYYSTTLKGFCSGDGEFGSGEVNETTDFFPTREVIFFPSNSVVRSGSFKYVPEASGAAHATGSTDVRTIYYISGANGPSGSFIPTSNFGSPDHAVSGSHIWSDAKLKTPASAGFYCDNAGNAVYGAFIGGDYIFYSDLGNKIHGVTSSIPEAQVVAVNGAPLSVVPRFASKSSHS